MNNTGSIGEKLAKYYLSQKGYHILEQNYRAIFGEIDIIAEKNNCICFVEVKCRTSDKYGFPEESITAHKKNKIIKVAQLYIKQNRIEDKLFRFDIIALNFNNFSLTRIKHITNAFYQ
ncbi:MAG TPA: YraN family protein [Atribacterota bacterium]|nr:YraN family protein [Atribacterota bacterium]